MRDLKAFIAAFLAIAAVCSVVSCGEGATSEDNPYANVDVDEEVRSKIKENAAGSGLLQDTELENKTIKWLSDWDINPDSTGKNKPTELVTFEEKYGGKIEYIHCEFSERYDKLAELIQSGDGVDFFYGGNMDAFPKGAIRNMFVPVDDYIDFSSPLWEGVKEVNDSLLWGGKHYCTVVQTTGDKIACMYNRKTIQEAGLQDPAKLYAQGKWDWNTFEEMLLNFVDVDNQHYGIDGWWYEYGLVGTTGVPAVSISNGRLTGNISDPAMERVQNYMYELNTKGCIAIGVGDFGWTTHPEYIGEGKMLFYPIGLYTMYTSPDQWKATYGEDAFFVPMPKDPSADAHYIPVGMESYCFIKGGANPEGVARFLDCKRFTLLDEETGKIGDEQFRADYGWTDEMVEMQHSMQQLANDHPVLDLAMGVSTDCTDLLDSNLRSAGRGTPWNETYDAIAAPLEKYLEEANEAADK